MTTDVEMVSQVLVSQLAAMTFECNKSSQKMTGRPSGARPIDGGLLLGIEWLYKTEGASQEVGEHRQKYRSSLVPYATKIWPSNPARVEIRIWLLFRTTPAVAACVADKTAAVAFSFPFFDAKVVRRIERLFV
jgi:hypothetical protein